LTFRYETETPKCFKCMRETFRLLNLVLDLVERYRMSLYHLWKFDFNIAYYDILERNFWHQNGCFGRFCSVFWNSDNLGVVRINFSRNL